jgi:hypothetical protein
MNKYSLLIFLFGIIYFLCAGCFTPEEKQSLTKNEFIEVANKYKILHLVADKNGNPIDRFSLSKYNSVEALENAFEIVSEVENFRTLSKIFYNEIKNCKSMDEILKISNSSKAYQDLKKLDDIGFNKEMLLEINKRKGDWMLFAGFNYKNEIHWLLSDDIEATGKIDRHLKYELINQTEVFAKHPDWKQEYLAYRKKLSESK